MAENLDFVIRAKAQVDGAVGKLKKLEGSVSRVGKQGEKTTKKLNKGFKQVSTSTGILAGVMAGVLFRGLSQAIKKASEFAEITSKFNTAFRAVKKDAKAMVRELVLSYNLSTIEATKLLSVTGDILKGFGFTGKEALKFSGAVQKLSADLSSYNDIPVAQASNALTKALLGERESLKSLGIVILESDVKNRLRIKGQEKLTGAMLRQAKVEATLELAMEQSGDAVGDVARTMDSTANQMRLFSNQWEMLTLFIGDIFMPTFNTLLVLLNKFMSSNFITGVGAWFMSLKGWVRFAVVGLLVLVPAIFAVIIAVGALIPMLGAGGAAFTALGASIFASLNMATLGIPILIAGIVGLSIVAYKFRHKILEAIKVLWDLIMRFTIVGLYIKAIKKLFSLLKDGVNALIDRFPILKKAIKKVGDVLGKFKDKVVAVWNVLKKLPSKWFFKGETENTTTEKTGSSGGGGGSDKDDDDGVQSEADADAERLENKQSFYEALFGLEDAHYKWQDLKEHEKAQKLKQAFKNQLGMAKKNLDGVIGLLKQELDAIKDKDSKEYKEKKNLLRNLYITRKATAISEIIISGAIGAARAFELGPILGPIMVGVSLANTAVQLGLAIAQPIPAFAHGGYLPEGQVGLVGERGAELIRGGKGGNTITPNSDTQKAMGGNVTNIFQAVDLQEARNELEKEGIGV